MFFFCNTATKKDGDEEPLKVKAAVFSNIALCHLKLKNFYEVKKAVRKKTIRNKLEILQQLSS